MKILYIFSNIHSVMLAEQVLLQMKVPVTVVSVPNEISAGCGLCLQIPSKYQTQAEPEMIKNSIMLSAIYQWQEANSAYQLVRSWENC